MVRIMRSAHVNNFCFIDLPDLGKMRQILITKEDANKQTNEKQFNNKKNIVCNDKRKGKLQRVCIQRRLKIMATLAR